MTCEADEAIDFDMPGAAYALAEAAGACGDGLYPHVRRWCRNMGTHRATLFSRAYELKVEDHFQSSGVIESWVDVVHHGKGFVVSIHEPRVFCDQRTCLYTPREAVFVKVPAWVDVRRIRTGVLLFRVVGMWKQRQWWGPRVEPLSMVLRDAEGQALGVGTLLSPIDAPAGTNP